MNWQDACEHKSLQNLPFKIELNNQGQILMSPVKVYHSLFQGKISGLLYLHLKEGEALVECAIKTTQGTKVADIAWASNERLKVIQKETECSIAPEICIEVMSAANTKEEMALKIDLYLAAGAKEVWLCSNKGKIEFHNSKGKLQHSMLAPSFPKQVSFLGWV